MRCTVMVEIRPGGRRAAELFAAGSNKYHGVPRTKGTKSAAVRRILEAPEFAGWTQQEIADYCGVTQQLVSWIKASIRKIEYKVGNGPPPPDSDADAIAAELRLIRERTAEAEKEANEARERSRELEERLLELERKFELAEEAEEEAVTEKYLKWICCVEWRAVSG